MAKGGATANGGGTWARFVALPATSPVKLPPIRGASHKQRAVLVRILRALGPSNIRQIVVRKLDKQLAKETKAPPGAVSILVDVPEFSKRAAVEMRNAWQAELIGYAFEVRSRSLHLPVVQWLIHPGEGSNLGMESGPGGQLKAHPPGPEQIAQHLAALGLTPLSIDRIKLGRGVAYAVRARTSNARQFIKKHFYPEHDVWGNVSWYAGTYLEVDNRAGKPILISTQSPTGEGAGYVLPSLKPASCTAAPTSC